MLTIQKLTKNVVFIRWRILPAIIKSGLVAIAETCAPLIQLTGHIVVRRTPAIMTIIYFGCLPLLQR